jgi:predicted nucleotidyltransferase
LRRSRLTRHQTNLPPPSVKPILDALLPAIRDALPNNLVGIYLTGSLALGDFDPATSDVDVIVVTERQASEAEFAALAAVHDRIPPIGNAYGQEYEVFYIDRETMRHWAPGHRHLRAEPDAALHWEAQRANFVIERWVLRERGVTLLGPEPKTLIDAVSAPEMREAALSELNIRIDDWAGGQPMPAWLGHRGAQGFEVETVCRALYTLATGELCSKQQALDWAKAELPAEWRPLLEWAQQYKKDRTRDAIRVEEVVTFVRYAIERASMSAE